MPPFAFAKERVGFGFRNHFDAGLFRLIAIEADIRIGEFPHAHFFSAANTNLHRANLFQRRAA